MSVDYKLNNKTIISFTDELLDVNNLGTFKRTIKNQILYFREGQLEYREKNYNYPIIPKLQERSHLINKFITMDLETFKENGVLVPYAVSIYDGKNINNKFFYLSDYKNSTDMLINAIKSIMTRKYHCYKVYLHNFSNFDGIFLLDILNQITDKIEIKKNEGRFIDIKIHFNNDKYKLHFRDSLLMLPASLDKLAHQFNVESKSIFPYDFVNSQNLNYKGSVPDIKYFKNMSLNYYNKYSSEYKYIEWDMRKETEKYCHQDCKTLFDILELFFKQNFDITTVNGSKYPSLSSLAFANFRTKFLEDNIKIANIRGEVYTFIKQGYFGGAVDVYKPYGKKLYLYDVNSLYPYIMLNNKMPIGQPTLIDGNSKLIESILMNNNKFSFVEVDVYCPEDVKAPLLLHRLNTNTVAPTGTWTDIYSSIEIKRAIQLGYKFHYKKCVYFECDYIFTNYVKYYYHQKKNSDKYSSHYTISKLMLNSLYGRFGMNPNLDQHIITNREDLNKLIESSTIKDIIQLSNGKDLISYTPDNVMRDDLTDKFRNSLTSIPIAAAITAGARNYMSKFKNMENYTLYYSDTDSIVLDRPLPQEYVGDELGQFKLEYIFDEAVFLCPKVYGGINSDFELVRVKGLRNPVKFDLLKTLLKKGSSLQSPNEIWYKDISAGNIKIKDEIYTLSVSDSKRQLIYDPNNNFVDTKPIHLNEMNNF